VSGNEREGDRPSKSVASDRPNIPGPARRPFGWLEEGTRAEIDTFRRRAAYEPGFNIIYIMRSMRVGAKFRCPLLAKFKCPLL
jgi:hypothetical protein